MARPGPKKPTDAELAILRALWDGGPSTVREVHERISKSSGVGLTTVLKLLQIMAEKGLATRDEGSRPARFVAARPKAETQRQLVRELAIRAFGSPSDLVLRALETNPPNDEEIAEIRRLLDAAKRRK